jgi:von Willebrand factor type A domain-containing protein
LGAGVLLAVFTACSSESSTKVLVVDSGASGSGGSGGTSGSAGVSGAGAAGSGTGGSSGTRPDAGSGASGGAGGTTDAGGDSAACSKVTFEAKTGLDMYFLIDKSASMGTTNGRWTTVVDGMTTLTTAGDTDGVGVGIGYFGFHPAGQPGVPTDPGSCNAIDYAAPDVPIAVLPGVKQAIVDSINRQQPGGARPTQAALLGALQYVTQWASAHPDRNAIVVLVTDGAPQGCAGSDVAAVAQVARTAAQANPPIKTYVIGLGTAQGINAIALAGSSQDAFFLADNSSGTQFVLELIRIFNSASGCRFALPQSASAPDPAKTSVVYTPTGAPQAIGHVSDSDACGSGGWYYETNPQGNPIAIQLCPLNCNSIIRGGRIEVGFDCPEMPPPP